jgi:hypothetical protein
MAIKLLQDYVQDGIVKDFEQPVPNYRFDTEGIAYNFRALAPGHIYTFVSLRERGADGLPSLDEYQISPTKSKKPYADNRPIFLSLGQEGPMEIGLNLKLMPIQLRKNFIRVYLKNTVLPVIENMVDSKDNLPELTQRLRSPEIKKLLLVDRQYIKLASDLSSFNFEFLVDKYNREEMRFLKMIDWPAVPKLGESEYVQDKTIVSKTPISYFLTKFT